MHSIPSSLKHKKRFLRWFITNELSEDDDVSWFLEDLLVDDKALLRLQFVEEIESYPKGMIISTLQNDDPFIFFKGSIQSINVYTAYHELQLYDDEPFYVQVKFPTSEKHRLFQLLLREEKINKKRDQAIASQMLHHLLFRGREDQIIQKIDWALDTKNEEMFQFYSEQLKQLKNNEPQAKRSNVH